MNLRVLEYVIAVAEHGGVTRAGRSFGLASLHSRRQSSN